MRFILVFIFILLIDLYAFKGVRLLTSGYSSTARIIIHITYWLITLIIIGSILYMFMSYNNHNSQSFYRKMFFAFGMLILFTVPKIVFVLFHLSDDILYLIRIIIAKFGASVKNPDGGITISRAKFLTQAGLVVAAIPFASIIYGIVKGRFNYKIRNVKLSFNNLPESFHGLKVVQISDFHIGSFTGRPKQVQQIVNMINEQEADILCFTGDLVNNFHDEAIEFLDILKQLKAKHGMFSILGNHDYGDYVRWNSVAEHQKNIESLIKLEKEAGFNVLLNDNFCLTKNGEKLSIIGVENWGLPPFPQHGNLKKAMNKVHDQDFKILLSHDPSHWDAEVLNKTNIDLTLSGHTHGMQFGVEIGNWKWSPVNMKYPRWADLYTENNQHLYVNRGIGYIAFPGRVGIMPEITVFELQGQA